MNNTQKHFKQKSLRQARGMVHGPGTGTSDSVHGVSLSAGEAVLPAETVRKTGGPMAIQKLIRQTTGKEPKHTLRSGAKYAGGFDGADWSKLEAGLDRHLSGTGGGGGGAPLSTAVTAAPAAVTPTADIPTVASASPTPRQPRLPNVLPLTQGPPSPFAPALELHPAEVAAREAAASRAAPAVPTPAASATAGTPLRSGPAEGLVKTHTPTVTVINPTATPATPAAAPAAEAPGMLDNIANKAKGLANRALPEGWQIGSTPVAAEVAAPAVKAPKPGFLTLPTPNVDASKSFMQNAVANMPGRELPGQIAHGINKAATGTLAAASKLAAPVALAMEGNQAIGTIMDPSKSMGNKIAEAGLSTAGRLGSAAAGAGLGTAAGAALGGPLAPATAALGGLVGGGVGYWAGDSAVDAARNALGIKKSDSVTQALGWEPKEGAPTAPMQVQLADVNAQRAASGKPAMTQEQFAKVTGRTLSNAAVPGTTAAAGAPAQNKAAAPSTLPAAANVDLTRPSNSDARVGAPPPAAPETPEQKSERLSAAVSNAYKHGSLSDAMAAVGERNAFQRQDAHTVQREGQEMTLRAARARMDYDARMKGIENGQKMSDHVNEFIKNSTMKTENGKSVEDPEHANSLRAFIASDAAKHGVDIAKLGMNPAGRVHLNNYLNELALQHPVSQRANAYGAAVGNGISSQDADIEIKDAGPGFHGIGAGSASIYDALRGMVPSMTYTRDRNIKAVKRGNLTQYVPAYTLAEGADGNVDASQMRAVGAENDRLAKARQAAMDAAK